MRRLFGDEVIIKAYTRAKAYGQESCSYRFIVQDYELDEGNRWQLIKDVTAQIPEGEELVSIECADDEHINYGEYLYSEEWGNESEEDAMDADDEDIELFLVNQGYEQLMP